MTAHIRPAAVGVMDHAVLFKTQVDGAELAISLIDKLSSNRLQVGGEAKRLKNLRRQLGRTACWQHTPLAHAQSSETMTKGIQNWRSRQASSNSETNWQT